MLTVVALLLLPLVFGMSVYRAWQVPRSLIARTLKLNRTHLIAAPIALATAYVALLVYTVFVLHTAAGTVLSPPKTVQELFSVAFVSVGYPFVYLVFEWVLFHSVKPGDAGAR